jgi:hypothetical protein
VSWWATATLTAQLPDDGQLRAASYSLRSVGDTLAGQCSVTRGVVDALGPAVWQDSSSGRATTILHNLCAELGAGSSAMYQAADALDSLAGYVAGQQWRYTETGQQLEEFARDPLGDLSPHKLAEAEQLIDERRSIEQNVSYAMGHAAEVISAAAARASRYHGTGGQSFWSSIEHDVSDFASGIWDGTYAIGKGAVKTVWSLAVLSAKLSPERLLLDPQGFMRDAEHAANTLTTTVDYLAHDKKQFLSNLLNLDELRKNPIHWAGELVPTIVLTILTFGSGGVAAKGAEVSDAIDATAGAGDTADAAGLGGRLPIDNVVNNLVKQDDFGAARYEHVIGDTGKTGGHTIGQHTNTSSLSNQDYIRSLQQEHGTVVDGKINPRETEGIWTSEQIRDDTFRKALPQLTSHIDSMLTTGRGVVAPTIRLDEPVGIALDDSDPFIRSSNIAKFVIRPASNMPEGFIIQTAFPVYDPTLPLYTPLP